MAIARAANQFVLWFVANTKDTTGIPADKLINRCQAPEKLLSTLTAFHPGEGKGVSNNCT